MRGTTSNEITMHSDRTAMIRPVVASVAAFVAFLLAGCSGDALIATPATVTVTAPAPPPETVTVTVTAAAAAPAPAADTPASGAQTSFDNGTFIVGTDIAPGTYRTAGPADPSLPLCAYERMKDTSGDLVEANLGGGSTQGPAVVTIKKTDAAFQSVGCKTWTKVG